MEKEDKNKEEGKKYVKIRKRTLWLVSIALLIIIGYLISAIYFLMFWDWNF